MSDGLFVGRRDTAGPAQDIALLLLRLILGVLILFHGAAKVVGGPGGILGAVTQAGLPAAFGYLVYVGEVVAPLLVIIGLWTRPAAIVIAINMIVAITLVHGAQIFAIADSGGWALELQGLYLIVAICVALLGAGRYSAGGRFGRWN